MATQFVPYSVMMRGMGYVRVPKTQQWIPESIMARRKSEAEMAQITAPFRKMLREDPMYQALNNGDMSWGELAQQEQDAKDAPFVNMTDDEWHTYLRTDKSKTWEECQRLTMLRSAKKALDMAERMPEQPKTCAYWYREYTQYPHLYFANEAEQKQAIAELMVEWRSEPSRWRLATMEQAAQKIQQAWRTYKATEDTSFNPTFKIWGGSTSCYCTQCVEADMCEECCFNPADMVLATVSLCRGCAWGIEYDGGNTFLCPRCYTHTSPSKATACGTHKEIGRIICESCAKHAPQTAVHYCGFAECEGDCGTLDCGCIDCCRCHCYYPE